MATHAGSLEELEKRSGAYAYVPVPSEGSAEHVLATLAQAAAACKACPLYVRGTQTVFGEGAAHALLMMVGEQPGDKEDREGRPFVGPAGLLLDKALAQAEMPREEVYLTNAVKHFNFVGSTDGGKARIHKKPRAAHIKACQAWVIEEIKVVRPKLLLCLGATAAQSFLGPTFRLIADRGRILEGSAWGVPLMATYHPSAVLRTPNPDRRAAMFTELVRDLQLAQAFVHDARVNPRRRRSLPVL